MRRREHRDTGRKRGRCSGSRVHLIHCLLMLALVTGGTGFVGSHLVEELLSRGWSVRCTVRSSSKLRWLEGKRVETVRADLLEPASLGTAADGADAVFHVAGVLRGENYAEYRRGNVEATRNLLNAAGE